MLQVQLRFKNLYFCLAKSELCLEILIEVFFNTNMKFNISSYLLVFSLFVWTFSNASAQANLNETASANKSSSSAILIPEATKAQDVTLNASSDSLKKVCELELSKLPGKSDAKLLSEACAKVEQFNICKSHENVPIYHFNKTGTSDKGKKILVFSLVHGDEPESGSVARFWMERLTTIDSRNTWRILPLVNPDGLKNKTRVNARGIDVNRNFPTEDWEKEAVQFWEKRLKKDPRRNPGLIGNSEFETQCMVHHIENFKPDFIISIHTPYGILDLDGPSISYPKYGKLPWVRFGNFPGSLGRYMWKDRNIPVLTVELKPGQESIKSLEDLEKLQDTAGLVAILSGLAKSKKEAAAQEKNKKNK